MSGPGLTRRHLRWGVAAAAVLALVSTRALDAHGQWRIEAAAGGASHEATGGAVTSASAILGLHHGGRRWGYVAAGLPLDAGLPWAAAGLGDRVAGGSGSLRVGVDAGVQAHGYREPESAELGGGAVISALPFVARELAGVRLEARSGLTHYSSSFAGQTIARTLHESGVTAEARPHSRLSLSGEAALFRADESDYPYVGAAAALVLGTLSLAAHAGHWATDAIPDPAWGVSGELCAGPRIALRASYQQESTDPLFWNETRRYWSLGVSRLLGRSAAARLVAPVLPVVSPDGVVFRIPVGDHTAPPSVAGDFNGWTPVRMHREGDDWIVAIPVPPGVHHYSFRAADGTWFVPDSFVNVVDDGFGGVNAVLVVPSIP